jgi:diaminohydroxyphosphoribosylaminopyrimidine deaminase / 5-amino-6-(5-phosphoribosylamino)uracil reductase
VSVETRGDERDGAFMRRALTLALLGWGRTAPNPLVGAVVVKDGEIVGEGWHGEFGGDHAERHALRNAGTRAQGATLYVTLEPCAHFGKTPPCADAILAAGVSRVVIASADPGERSGGGGRRLLEAGVSVDFGVEEGAARELNAPFFSAAPGSLPWLTLKLALSLDGAITDSSRSSAWLTGDAARDEVHRMRAGSDAIMVGVGTVNCDDPLLTARRPPFPRVAPVRIVLDRAFTTPPESRIVRTSREVPTWIVSTDPQRAAGAADRRRKLEGEGVETFVADSLEAGFRQIGSRGVQSVLAEGGAAVSAALLRAGLVDRLVIFQAPIILGAGALHPFAELPAEPVRSAGRLRVVDRREFGADVKTTYALKEF